MFGFSKKKEKEEPIQPMGTKPKSGQPLQATKVEDDMASFEIPDFSDDDLNFDLGLGEFMPQGGLPPLPVPKGLPTEQTEQPKSSTQDTSHMQIEPQLKDEDVPSPDVVPRVDKQLKQQKELEIDNSIDVNDELVDPDAPEDLPKFSIESPIDFSVENSGSEQKEVKSIKTKHQKKEHQDKQAVHTSKLPAFKNNEIKHYAQASPEGFFVPKDVYRKIIILADDTSKKTVYGEEVKRNCSLLSKMKKEFILDADKDAVAIKDAIMSADLRLFGGKEN